MMIKRSAKTLDNICIIHIDLNKIRSESNQNEHSVHMLENEPEEQENPIIEAWCHNERKQCIRAFQVVFHNLLIAFVICLIPMAGLN